MLNKSFLAAVGTSAALVVIFLPPGPATLLIALLFSGLAPMALTSRRWTVPAFIAAIVSIGPLLWAIFSLISWELGANQPQVLSFIVSACCLLYLMVRPQGTIKFYKSDPVTAMAIMVCTVMALPIIAIYVMNGPRSIDGIPVFDARLWVYNDSYYLFALAQQALDQKGYPLDNPFLQGAPNKYPSLLHCGIAGLSGLSGPVVALAFWVAYPIVIISGIVACFCAIAQRFRSRTLKVIGTFTLGYLSFLLIRIDLFAFFQATSLCFTLLGLTLFYFPYHFSRSSLSTWLPFTGFACLLAFSHTVTSTAVVVLSCCLSATLIMRRKRHSISAIASSIVILGVYIWVNWHKAVSNIPVPATTEFKSNAIRELIYPFLVPLILLIILALQKRMTAFSWSALVLYAGTGLYWFFGISADSINRMIFSIFNAPRLALFGLLFALVKLRGYSKKDTFVVILLFCYVVAFPNRTVRDSLGLVTLEPESFPVKQIMELRQELKTDQAGQGLITNIGGFAISTFSGFPTYFDDRSYYAFALGTVDEAPIEARKQLRSDFFNKMSPHERLDHMRTNNLFAVVKLHDETTTTSDAQFLPPSRVNHFTGQYWSIYTLRH